MYSDTTIYNAFDLFKIFPQKNFLGIYKITSPSNRVYIGQSINIKSRIFDQYRIYNCKEQRIVYRSLKKYGFEAHKFEIIKECSLEELNKWERYFQDYYISLGFRLGKDLMNLKLTETNDKSGVLSEEVKQNVSKGLKEYYKNNPDSIKKGREHHSYGRESWCKGIKLPKEMCNKMSDSKKKYIKENYEKFMKDASKASKGKGKIIKQLDIETEEIIKEATIDVFMAEGFIKTSIYYVCNGKMKTSQGFKWRFKDDADEKYKSKTKVILQLDMNTEEILKEGIISDFTKNGFSKEGIYLCCNGKRKYSQGFKWSFKDFESPKFEFKRNLRIIQKLNPETLEVLEEGDIYHFDKQNYKRNNIYNAIIKNHFHDSFKWRYKP